MLITKSQKIWSQFAIVDEVFVESEVHVFPSTVSCRRKSDVHVLIYQPFKNVHKPPGKVTNAQEVETGQLLPSHTAWEHG